MLDNISPKGLRWCRFVYRFMIYFYKIVHQINASAMDTYLKREVSYRGKQGLTEHQFPIFDNNLHDDSFLRSE